MGPASDRKCTVAIPVFNQRQFVARAIESALTQDVRGLSVIVVDNCSTDGTWELVQQYATSGVDLVRNPANLGLFGNFNRCIELAKSEYLRILCSDDALPERCLGAEISLLERLPNAAMLSTTGYYVDPTGQTLGQIANDFPPGVYDGRAMASRWLEYYAHYRRNPLNYPSGVLFRMACVHAAGRFDETFTTTGDIEFYLRVLQHGDLVISDALGCLITRHSRQTHVGPNLDGTAIREQLRLVERYAPQLGVRALPRLRDQFGGMCLGLAAHRYWSGSTRESARLHVALGHSIASGWLGAVAGLLRIAICRGAKVVLGHRAPFVPSPEEPL
jgi:glycosyltransferase involved in cell wall biosynthesis